MRRIHNCADRGPVGEMEWGRAFVINLIVSGVATALLLTFQGNASLPQTLLIFTMAFTYSFSIGTLAALVLSRLAPEPDSLPYGLGWLILVVELIAVTIVGTIFAASLLTLIGLQPRAYFLQTISMSLKFSIIMALTFGIGMYYYETTRARLKLAQIELQRRQLEEERARKLAAEAQLSSLESRIHPHFLFNTLNSIAALIPEDPAAAEEMVQKLATLLRFSLDSSTRGLVPLAQEIKVVTDYLEIEKARLGGRLRYSLDVPEAVASREVPPLCLQTLVENAVKYAVAPRRGGGEIRVSAAAGAGGLQLDVEDDGPGFTAAAMLPGHGLENLQARLAALFGDAARLTISRNGDARTLVRLHLPAAAPAPPAESE